MKFLLDHMVTKKVRKLLEELGYDVKSAKQLGFETLTNGKLYEKAQELKRILITYDRDFQEQEIGESGSSSIIQVRIHPSIDSNVLPIIENHVAEISNNHIQDYFIIFDAQGIKYDKF